MLLSHPRESHTRNMTAQFMMAQQDLSSFRSTSSADVYLSGVTPERRQGDRRHMERRFSVHLDLVERRYDDRRRRDRRHAA